MEKKKIAFVLGTRAELIKTAPVMIELRNNKTGYYFIHTGQHNLRELCDVFGLSGPDIVLSKTPNKSSKFNANIFKAVFWNISLVFKLRNLLKGLKETRYVIYHGDTMTTASAAISSSKLLNPWKKYKNVHLEAGLRSGNIFEPFPEEISRIIADKFSDILLTVSRKSTKNVSNYKKRIINTGNTIVDSIDLAERKSGKLKSLSKGKFALISIHRHENIKNRRRLSRIIEILESLEIPSYFAMHDNTKNQIVKFGFYDRLKRNKNIHIIKPLDYFAFIHQMKKCSLLICDGGSIQEESLIFMKPCIILRDYTERPEGLESNFQFLSRLNVEMTKKKIREYLAADFKPVEIKNPYGEKGLSKKIVGVLK